MSKPERVCVLEGHLRPGRHGAPAGEAVSLQLLRRDVVEITARAGPVPRLREAARLGLGLELPAVGASRSTRRLLALGLGPGIWSALSQPGEPGTFHCMIATALAGTAAVVETGHGLVVLRLGGPRVRGVLAKGCRLDLHPSAFEPGQAARTIIAQIPVTLWREDAGEDDAAGHEGRAVFALAAPLGFAQSFVHFLLAASAETGCEVLPAAKD